ncbi:MAG: hypothetical protein M1816_004306 [Peltula sp. TS41687]|nr:MAG: hypothetical protein M1816_004306 [Peltula sp. TS41687]
MDRTGDSEMEIVDGSMVEEATEVDVEMTVTQTEVIETKPVHDRAANGTGDVDVDTGDNGEVEVVETESAPARRLTFIDYLKSPIVEILVGSDNDPTLLTAHQGLLTQSPYFASMCALFGDEEIKRVELPDHDLDAVGCFLQYLYTGEYFPKKLHDSRTLESDPSISKIDNTGEQLLKHARVYVLAEKLGVPQLQTLAHSKIHRINSTARGEIAYARFVYEKTSRDDTTIRKPIAAFWAHRSHVLRHEAEDEFRKMCLEFPEFGFDVLSLVLDAKEKGKDKEKEKDHHGGERSARKRARTSGLN